MWRNIKKPLFADNIALVQSEKFAKISLTEYLNKKFPQTHSTRSHVNVGGSMIPF